MAGEIPPSDGIIPPAAPPPPARPAVRSFNCPSCGAPLTITAVGQTVTVGCRSCGSTLDTSKPEVALVEKGTGLAQNIYIPIGTRGKLRGIEWMVIGVMGRIDPVYLASWKEYLLYNPYQGFRWLTEANGHWNYVVPMKEIPKPMPGKGIFAQRKPGMHAFARNYLHFQGGEALVEFVLGEFYWQVKKGDKSKMDDYIAPPEMISSEKSGSEILWSHSTYEPPEEIVKAFKLPRPLPTPVGVAPNQPSLAVNRWQELKPVWGKLTLATLALMVLHSVTSPNRRVLAENLTFNPTATEKVKTLPSFELKKLNNVQVELWAGLENNFMDLDIDLVNDATGYSHDMQVGAEYWSGYDSDGSWTEGSRTSSDLEPSVNPGTYHLVVTQGASGSTNPVPYNLVVTSGVSVHSNFILALLALSLFPIYFLLRKNTFESERWASSDYAPADSDDE